MTDFVTVRLHPGVTFGVNEAVHDDGEKMMIATRHQIIIPRPITITPTKPLNRKAGLPNEGIAFIHGCILRPVEYVPGEE